MKDNQLTKFLIENKERIQEICDKHALKLEEVYKEREVQGAVEYAYSFIDAAHKQVDLDSKTTCGSGCSFCCYGDIHMSVFEAQYMLAFIEYKGIKKSKSDFTVQNNKKWHKLKHADKRCGMLDDEGKCSVYDARPTICRLWNSTSIVKRCEDQKPTTTVRILEAWAMSISLIEFSAKYSEGTDADMVLHEVMFDNLKE